MSNYKRTNRLIGVDPTIKKLKRFYRKDIITVPEFFSSKIISKYLKSEKAKIITSISMFYDLPAPIQFAQDIYECLDSDKYKKQFVAITYTIERTYNSNNNNRDCWNESIFVNIGIC